MTDHVVSAMIIFIKSEYHECRRNGIYDQKLHSKRIEVACFISTVPDVSGTREGPEKGKTPKEERPDDQILGMQ